MNTQPNPPNPDIDLKLDSTLSALRNAPAPAGLADRINARMAHRLAEQPAAYQASSRAPSATWWRGALTGAAFATLALCTCTLIVHRHATHSSTNISTAITRTSSASPQTTTRVAFTSAERHPCPTPSVLSPNRKANFAVPQPLQIATIDETSAPSHPAPVLPLTAQERQLTHLVRTTDPRQLAALGLDQEARLQVEKSTGFTTHPSPVSAGDAATPQPNSTPEAVPQSTPANTTPNSAPEPFTTKSSTEEQI
jgi:hypothetical protein